MKTILVTGGAGYIGSLLCSRLLEGGDRVLVVDSLLFGAEPLLPFHGHRNFAFRKGDAFDAADHGDWFEAADAVVHLAAIVGYPACDAVGREAAWRANVETTGRVLEAAEAGRVERIVFASTYSNYGRAEDGKPVDESSPLHPQSLYAETKIAAERLLIDAAGGPTAPIVLRFATLFGISPRTRFDLIVNQFVLEALTHRRLVVFERGYHRSFVHVADAVRAIARVLDEPDPTALAGEVFNVGSATGNHTKDDILALVQAVVPDLEIVLRDLSFEGDMRDVQVSFDKIERVLGYTTTRTVADGVAEVHRALAEGWIPDPTAARYRNAEFIVQ